MQIHFLYSVSDGRGKNSSLNSLVYIEEKRSEKLTSRHIPPLYDQIIMPMKESLIKKQS